MANNNAENEIISVEPVFYIHQGVQTEEVLNVPTNNAAMDRPYNKEVSEKQNCHIWLYILEYLAVCQENGDMVPELPPMLWPFKKQFTDFLECEERKKIIKTLEEQCIQEIITTHPNLPVEPEERNMNVDDDNSDHNPENIPNPNPVSESSETDSDSDENDTHLLFNMDMLVKRFHTFTCGTKRCRTMNRNRLVPRRRTTPKVRAWMRFRRQRHNQFDEFM